MLVLFPKIKNDAVLVADLEYDNNGLMQFAGLLLVNQEDDVFQVYRSFNFYVKRSDVNKYAVKYTGITNEFLTEHGLEKDELIEKYNELVKDVNLKNTLFVSHGSKNDRKVLREFGLTDLPQHSFCTYKNSKKVLKRDKQLKLKDVAHESGFFLGEASHDAYLDAWATVSVFSYLTENG